MINHHVQYVNHHQSSKNWAMFHNMLHHQGVRKLTILHPSIKKRGCHGLPSLQSLLPMHQNPWGTGNPIPPTPNEKIRLSPWDDSPRWDWLIYAPTRTRLPQRTLFDQPGGRRRCRVSSLWGFTSFSTSFSSDRWQISESGRYDP